MSADKGMWVVFTEDGVPAWFGPAWVEGAKWVEGETHETLLALVPPPPPPTAEALAEMQAELARQDAEAAAAAEVARLVWIEQEIARRADPDALLRSMGKITIAELNTRVALIRAAVEAEFPVVTG